MKETAVARMARESRKITDFIELMDTAKKQNVQLIDAVHKMNNRQQDILHEIELQKMYSTKGVYTLKELQKLRQDRRVAKDTLDLWRPFKDFVNAHPDLKNDLIDVLKNIEAAAEKQNARVYYPRTKSGTDPMRHSKAPEADIEELLKA